MRRFVFTERDRRLLEAWMAGEEETQDMRKILSQIRKGWPKLADDMELLFRTIDVMMKRERWRERLTGGSEFGSTLRRAVSGLTRARRDVAT
jgi:hypothetical protein